MPLRANLSRSGNPSSKSGLARTTSAAKRSGKGATFGRARCGVEWREVATRAASHRLTRRPQRHWQRSTANKVWARGRLRPHPHYQPRIPRRNAPNIRPRHRSRRWSSWCADDLVRIPRLGAGSKGMRTGASAHPTAYDGSSLSGTSLPPGPTGPAPPHPDAAGRQCPSAREALRQVFATPLPVRVDSRRLGRAPPRFHADHGARPQLPRHRASRHREVEQISRGMPLGSAACIGAR